MHTVRGNYYFLSTSNLPRRVRGLVSVISLHSQSSLRERHSCLHGAHDEAKAQKGEGIYPRLSYADGVRMSATPRRSRMAAQEGILPRAQDDSGWVQQLLFVHLSHIWIPSPDAKEVLTELEKPLKGLHSPLHPPAELSFSTAQDSVNTCWRSPSIRETV